MLPCVRCGQKTELRVLGVPLCPTCDALQDAELNKLSIIIERKPESAPPMN